MSMRSNMAGPLTGMLLGLTGFSGSAVANTIFVDGSGGGCGGNAPCETTVQAAVDAATLPADIRIFPGTYSESVDLSTMNGGAPGTISFQALNDSGGPATGTVTLSSPGGPALWILTTLVGNFSAAGLNFSSPTSNGLDVSVQGQVNLTDLTANNTGGDGLRVNLLGNGSNLNATRIVANGNSDKGASFLIPTEVNGNSHTFTVTDATINNNNSTGLFIGRDEQVQTTMVVDVTLSRITANGNESDGIRFRAVNGTGRVSNSEATGNEADGIDLEDAASAYITDSNFADNDTEGNNNSGIEVDASSTLLISNVDVSGHTSGKGIEIDGWAANGGDVDDEKILGDVNISKVEASGNNIGIRLDAKDATGTINIQSTNFGGNATAGLMIDDDADPTMVVNAAGNFWGAASGPTHPTKNPSGTGDVVADASNVVDGSVGTINFAPFSSSRVSLAAPVPALPASFLFLLVAALVGVTTSRRKKI